MENQSQSQPTVPSVPVPAKISLPNSTEALILGIISIPTCCCVGIFGLAAGIIAIVLGGNAVKLYKANPDLYTKSSYDNANAGYVCGIIGTVLSGIYVLYLAIYLIVLIFYGAIIASAFSGTPF